MKNDTNGFYQHLNFDSLFSHRHLDRKIRENKLLSLQRAQQLITFRFSTPIWVTVHDDIGEKLFFLHV